MITRTDGPGPYRVVIWLTGGIYRVETGEQLVGPVSGQPEVNKVFYLPEQGSLEAVAGQLRAFLEELEEACKPSK